MTEQQKPYNTTPKVDALTHLLKVFTPEQLEKIAKAGLVLQAERYGEIVIRFENGRPRFFIRESEILP